MTEKCPHCGEPMPEEADFCLACFKSVGGTKSVAPVSKIRKSVSSVLKSKRFIYAAASLIVIFAAIAAMSLRTADSGITADYNNRSDASISELGDLPHVNSDAAVFLPNIGQSGSAASQPVSAAATVSETGGSFIDYLKNKFGAGNVSVADSLPQNPNGEAEYNSDALQQGVQSDTGRHSSAESNAGNSYTNSHISQGSNSGTDIQQPQLTEKTHNNGSNGIPITSQIQIPTETQKPAETQKPTEAPKPVYTVEAGMWEYKDYNKSGTQAELTKYNGSRETVVVPALIDGKKVVSLGTGALKDNNSIKCLRFDGENEFPFLWIEKDCIKNCPNLETIYFPDSDLGVVNGFASGVPKLANAVFANSQYRSQNGMIYYYSGAEWYLRFVCPAAKVEVYDIPGWCVSIEGSSNIQDNPYIRVINVHEAVNSLWDFSYSPPNLEEINVDNRNPYLMSADGVAYQRSGGVSWLPAKNKHTQINVPEGCALYLVSTLSSPYIKSIRFAETSKLINPLYLSPGFNCFPALETVYFKSGSDVDVKVRSYFYGNIITY